MPGSHQSKSSSFSEAVRLAGGFAASQAARVAFTNCSTSKPESARP